MSADLEYGRRRLRAVIFVIVLLAVIGVGVNTYLGHRALSRTGSRVVSSGKPFRIGRIPAAYHEVVRVDTRAGPTPVINTERVWVRRPFESRIETWVGKTRSSVRISRFGGLANLNPSSAPLSIAIPPSVASGDLRVDAAIPDALRRHVIVRRERRIVYGRECQVYRAGGPISAGDLTKYRSGSTEYADFCVDRRGIVVEEFWVRNSKLLRRRVATSVEIPKSLPDKLFAITVPTQQGFDKGSIERVTTKLDRKIWVLPQTPSGWTLLGRFAVVLPTSATASPSQIPEPPTTSVTDVYVRGPDLLVIDQDPSLESAAASEQRSTIPVKVRGLKSAVLLLDGRANELRAETSDGSFIRVVGTLPPATLFSLGGSLQLVAG